MHTGWVGFGEGASGELNNFVGRRGIIRLEWLVGVGLEAGERDSEARLRRDSELVVREG